MFITPERSKINIMGTEVEVIIDSSRCTHEEAAGLYLNGTIYLLESYEDVKEYKRIFTHECFHALCEILGVQLDIHTEEVLAHTMSSVFAYEV